MGQSLSVMAMMNIHPDQIPSPHAILDRFMMLKNRRIYQTETCDEYQVFAHVFGGVTEQCINSFNGPMKGICV